MHLDSAKEGAGEVAVSNASSTQIAAANPNRGEITIINDGANVVYLALGEAAVAGKGIRLNASGGSYTTQIFRGVVNGIAMTASTDVCYVEV